LYFFWQFPDLHLQEPVSKTSLSGNIPITAIITTTAITVLDTTVLEISAKFF
jgi:hypothetical protein